MYNVRSTSTSQTWNKQACEWEKFDVLQQIAFWVVLCPPNFPTVFEFFQFSRWNLLSFLPWMWTLSGTLLNSCVLLIITFAFFFPSIDQFYILLGMLQACNICMYQGLGILLSWLIAVYLEFFFDLDFSSHFRKRVHEHLHQSLGVPRTEIQVRWLDLNYPKKIWWWLTSLLIQGTWSKWNLIRWKVSISFEVTWWQIILGAASWPMLLDLERHSWSSVSCRVS